MVYRTFGIHFRLHRRIFGISVVFVLRLRVCGKGQLSKAELADIMAVKENSEPEDFEWNTEEEVQLLYALDGLRPVGINKHVYMARICERMSAALKRDIAPEVIWAQLRTWYNLEALDQMERLPFAEEQVEFSLPDSEFSALISQRLAENIGNEKQKPAAEVKEQPTKTETTINTKGGFLVASKTGFDLLAENRNISDEGKLHGKFCLYASAFLIGKHFST